MGALPVRRAMLLLGLAVAVWAALGADVRATRGARLTADEPQYVLTAISLWEDHDLDIADELAAERWRDFHEVQLPEQTEPRPDGSRLSPHNALLPLVLAPFVGLGGWLGAKLALAATAGALAAALLWTAVRHLGLPLSRAALTVECFSFAAPLAVYGTQVYPELPAALVVTLTVGAVLSRRPALAAAGVVALPWLSVKYAPVAAALAAVLLWRADARQRAALAGGLALAGAAYLAFHHRVYGGLTPYAAGDHFTGGELTVAGTSPDVAGRTRRLVGLLVDREFGLAAWQPAWLLAVPAVAALLRRRPRRWAVVALPLAAGWATATWVALTMHGWWFPGRQVVVVLPLAVLAVAWWRPPRAVLVAGLAWGALTYAWLVLDDVTWAFDFMQTSNPLYRAWRTVLPGPHDGVLLAVWAAGLAALALLGLRDEDARAGERADADVAVLDADRDGAVR